MLPPFAHAADMFNSKNLVNKDQTPPLVGQKIREKSAGLGLRQRHERGCVSEPSEQPN